MVLLGSVDPVLREMQVLELTRRGKLDVGADCDPARQGPRASLTVVRLPAQDSRHFFPVKAVRFGDDLLGGGSVTKWTFKTDVHDDVCHCFRYRGGVEATAPAAP